MKELLLRPQFLSKKLNVVYQQCIYRSIELHKLLHRASLQSLNHILNKPLRVQIHHRKLDLFYIDAPIPSFGSGSSAYARVDDNGEVSSIVIKNVGSGYRFTNPPAITIDSENGEGASAVALINGVKNLQLLSGGIGYSTTNPPIVNIESPTQDGSKVASIDRKSDVRERV